MSDLPDTPSKQYLIDCGGIGVSYSVDALSFLGDSARKADAEFRNQAQQRIDRLLMDRIMPDCRGCTHMKRDVDKRFDHTSNETTYIARIRCEIAPHGVCPPKFRKTMTVAVDALDAVTILYDSDVPTKPGLSVAEQVQEIRLKRELDEFDRVLDQVEGDRIKSNAPFS